MLALESFCLECGGGGGQWGSCGRVGRGSWVGGQGGSEVLASGSLLSLCQKREGDIVPSVMVCPALVHSWVGWVGWDHKWTDSSYHRWINMLGPIHPWVHWLYLKAHLNNLLYKLFHYVCLWCHHLFLIIHVYLVSLFVNLVYFILDTDLLSFLIL